MDTHEGMLTPVDLNLINDLWVPNVFIYNLKSFQVGELVGLAPGSNTWVQVDLVPGSRTWVQVGLAPTRRSRVQVGLAPHRRTRVQVGLAPTIGDLEFK